MDALKTTLQVIAISETKITSLSATVKAALALRLLVTVLLAITIPQVVLAIPLGIQAIVPMCLAAHETTIVHWATEVALSEEATLPRPLLATLRLVPPQVQEAHLVEEVVIAEHPTVVIVLAVDAREISHKTEIQNQIREFIKRQKAFLFSS